ncbi:GNAT family N-acetyltransferase [Streptomyces sp. NPDC058001]|uniref:GNAT family N-acetyltransferase n=1 Tax=Streptomyces sp. NPDC058001 TaxID=3346300 RepID=UPI0036E5239C
MNTGTLIRRITESEGPAVAALWNRMVQEIPDGGPLPPGGEARIGRMLSTAAWHHQAFCLVAVLDGDVIGYVNGALDHGDGLLPPPMGRLECLYVVPAHRGHGTGRALARAAFAHLKACGAGTLRIDVGADDPRARAYWEGFGFEADTVTLSRYEDDAAGSGVPGVGPAGPADPAES